MWWDRHAWTMNECCVFLLINNTIDMPDEHEQSATSQDDSLRSNEREADASLAPEKLEEAEMASKLEECRKEKNEYLLGWQRCKADATNIKQQYEARNLNMIQFAAENLILSLIPVLDTFDHALQGKDASDPYVQGFGYVQTQLLSILFRQGLAIISDTGALFDVSRHEAVESVSVTEEKDSDKIIETIEKGYILHGKVIKPAKVKIGEYANTNHET